MFYLFTISNKWIYELNEQHEQLEQLELVIS